MKIRLSILLAACLFACVSCMYHSELEIEQPEPRAVLNAILSPDSLLVVQVWKTRNQIEQPASWEYRNKNYFVKGAGIEVFANGQKRGLMLADETNTRYVLPGYRPAVGDYIELRATTPQYDPVSASTDIPGPVSILSIDTTCTVHADDYVEQGTIDLHLTFRDRPGEKNYYLVSFIPFMRWEKGDFAVDPDTLGYGNTVWYDIATNETSAWEKGHILLSSNGYYEQIYHGFLITDEGLDGQLISLDATFSSVNFSYRDSLCTGTRRCRILLSSISESYYFYRRSKALQIEQNDILGESGLREPVPTYSNVRGGYGLVGARQDAVYDLVFPFLATRKPYDYPYYF